MAAPPAYAPLPRAGERNLTAEEEEEEEARNAARRAREAVARNVARNQREVAQRREGQNRHWQRPDEQLGMVDRGEVQREERQPPQYREFDEMLGQDAAIRGERARHRRYREQAENTEAALRLELNEVKREYQQYSQLTQVSMTFICCSILVTVLLAGQIDSLFVTSVLVCTQIFAFGYWLEESGKLLRLDLFTRFYAWGRIVLPRVGDAMIFYWENDTFGIRRGFLHYALLAIFSITIFPVMFPMFCIFAFLRLVVG